MSEKCGGDCASCKENCEKREQPESLLEKLNEWSSVKKVIGVMSGKGGVGKSSVTALLAVLLSKKGYRCAIMDADLTGPSIPKMFGLTGTADGDGEHIFPVRTKGGIEVISMNLLLEKEDAPVIWRGPVIAGVIKQFWTDVAWGDIDYMLIDLPPGTGDAPLTVFQSIPLNGVIVVTTPQELVSMIVKKAVRMAEMMRVPILGLVENMSYVTCPDCGKRVEIFGHSREDALQGTGVQVLSKLPMDGNIARMADEGRMEQFDKDWLDAAVLAVEKL